VQAASAQRAAAATSRARARRGGSPPGGVTLEGLRISHPDKVWWPDEGITKLDIARYYLLAPRRVREPGAEHELVELARFHLVHVGIRWP
jgi:bifunctional non-homologous end joining protein LigD